MAVLPAHSAPHGDQRSRVRATVRGTGSRVREATPWHFRLGDFRWFYLRSGGIQMCNLGSPTTRLKPAPTKALAVAPCIQNTSEEDRKAHRTHPHLPGQGTAVRGGAVVCPGGWDGC